MSKPVHILAVVTAVATWFLLIAGALVTSTGAGLSVPDWPLSYGQWMPPMIGGVFYEHGHRMVAGTVALLTAFLAFALALYEPRLWVRCLGWLALSMVVIQATLGGLTVLMRLPPIVSVSHAVLGQSFFCVVVLLAWVTSPRWDHGGVGSRPRDFTLFAASAALTAAFFVQLFLGAATRHLKAGLSIPDFPSVYGGWLPPVWTAQIAYHFAHRTLAYFLVAAVFGLAVYILARERRDRARVFLALCWVGLIAVQFLLGALTIWMQRPVVVTSAHLAVGALCLVVSFLLTFRLGWAAWPSRSRLEAAAIGGLA